MMNNMQMAINIMKVKREDLLESTKGLATTKVILHIMMVILMNCGKDMIGLKRTMEIVIMTKDANM
jgi:hypothetical protein